VSGALICVVVRGIGWLLNMNLGVPYAESILNS
jgi:hypothetical protein